MLAVTVSAALAAAAVPLAAATVAAPSAAPPFNRQLAEYVLRPDGRRRQIADKTQGLVEGYNLKQLARFARSGPRGRELVTKSFDSRPSDHLLELPGH